MGDLPYLDKVVNGHKFFFNPTDAIRVAVSPRIGVGPGFDSQGSVTVAQKVAQPVIFCSSSPRSQANCGPGLLYLAALQATLNFAAGFLRVSSGRSQT